MSDFSPTLVLQIKICIKPDRHAKVAIKSEKLSPFGGFFSIMEQFDPKLSHQSHCGVRGIYKMRIFAL